MMSHPLPLATGFRSLASRAWGALLAAVCAAGGCMSTIGDSCATNVECSPSGDRICDTAQPDGYCTVQGCGPDTCPEEAVCIAFYPTAFLSVPCDPVTEDAVDPARAATDHCAQDEVCLSAGFCALFSLERRFCMKSCEDDSDCRDEYECRPTGRNGAEVVRDRESPTTTLRRFCAQRN